MWVSSSTACSVTKLCYGAHFENGLLLTSASVSDQKIYQSCWSPYKWFTKMNFSELFKQTNQLCKFSPDGRYLVSTYNFKSVNQWITSSLNSSILFQFSGKLCTVSFDYKRCQDSSNSTTFYLSGCCSIHWGTVLK